MENAEPHRRRVLVTGASSGLGRACVVHLAALGFEVYAGVRRPEDGDSVIQASAGRARAVLLDVTQPSHIDTAAESLAGGAGLWGLVNNAGITVPGPLELMPLAEFRRQMDVNVVGALAVTQRLMPLLRSARGRVVNIGSLSGRVALPFYGAYAATKFALEALTDALRVELRPWGVRVILVEPGAVRTGIWDRALAAGDVWFASAPPSARALYVRAMAGVRANARRLERAAFPPETVARCVGTALTSRRPRARYRVAYPLSLRALLLLDQLPTSVRDAVIARTLPR